MTISTQVAAFVTDTGANASVDFKNCDGELVQLSIVNSADTGIAIDTGATITLTYDPNGANVSIFSSQITSPLVRGIYDTGGDPLYLNGETVRASVQGRTTADTGAGADTGKEFTVKAFLKEVH